MNIATIYETMTEDHNEFLWCADEVAAVTIPTLKPTGKWPGTRVSGEGTQNAKPGRLPSTYTGIQAVRSLAATIMDTMMPHGVKWVRLDLPPAIWAKIKVAAEEAGLDPDDLVLDITRRLDQRATEIVKSLKHKNAAAMLASAVRRNLVEGTDAIINLPGIVDVFPLRCIRVHRVSGNVAYAVFEEEVNDDPLAEVSKGDDNKQSRYTLINYRDNEVWIQEGEDGTPKKSDERQAHQYIVFTGEIPDIGHYSVGYAYNFLKLIKNLDHVEQSLNEAMVVAAMNYPMATPGSVLAEDLNVINTKRPGEWTIADQDSAWWFNSGNKIGDWSFIAQIAARYDSKLAQAFAMGIKDRNLSPDTPATAIIEIVKELNRQTQDLLGTLERTMLQPLVRSENQLIETISPIFAEDADLSAVINATAEVVITTGVNAIAAQRSIMQFALQFVPAVMQYDPTVRADGVGLLNMMADTMQVEGVHNTYRRATEEELAAAAGQAGGGDGSGPDDTGDHVMTRGGPQRRGGDAQPQNQA